MKKLSFILTISALFSFVMAAEQPAAKTATAASQKAATKTAAAVERPAEADTVAPPTIDEIEKRYFEKLTETGTSKQHSPLAVKAMGRLVSYKQAALAEPHNRLLPMMLKSTDILVDAAIAEARGIKLRSQLDSVLQKRIETQAEIRSIQNQIIQREQSRSAKLQGNLAQNEQLLSAEKRRAAEYADLMLKEQQRADEYSQLASEERDKSTKLSQLAEQERQKAADALRLADSLQAEAKKRQDEARNRLNALQSKLIQVTQDARGIILSMSDILFAVNKADLTPDLQQNLAKIAGILTVYKESKIIVEGHTDNTGSKEHNQTLSEKRAGNVQEYLVKMGLEPQRLQAVGYGMSKPVASNNTPAGRQKNRRVDLVISDAQLEGR